MELTQYHFSFALVKDSYDLELLRLFITNKTNRTVIAINDNNRASILSSLDTDIKNILSQFVENDPQYMS